MSPRLRIYVAGVLAVAAVTLAATVPPDLRANGLHYLAWVGISIASESLWLPAMSGTGTVTMASSAGLASIVR